MLFAEQSQGLHLQHCGADPSQGVAIEPVTSALQVPHPTKFTTLPSVGFQVQLKLVVNKT